MSITQAKKINISLFSALLFFVVANPTTFKIVRKMLGDWVASPGGCPTTTGLFVHSIVYFGITLALMQK